MTAPIPFSDDSELAVAALQSKMSRAAAILLIEAIDKIRREARGSREAPPTHPRPAHSAADPSGAASTPVAADAGTAGPGASQDAGVEIPDRITPFVGWRAWRLNPFRPQLLSMHQDTLWSPGEILVATCDVPKRRHTSCACPTEPAPALNCRCGIYATRELSRVDEYVNGAPSLAPEERLVLGRVALWGSVLEYEHGWRAEFAYPQSFYLTEKLDAEMSREHLRAFEVPVLGPAELADLGWTREVPERPWTRRDWPDAPGVPEEVAKLSLDAVQLDTRARTSRFVNAARRAGIERVGQLLGATDEDITRWRGIGHAMLEQFHAWRHERGFGDPPEEVTPVLEQPAVSEPEADDPPSVANNDPPSVANKCCMCGSLVMAYGRGRVLCETCRPINAQISALRSGAKRAANIGASTTAYEELIATLEAQRPRPNVNGTPS